MCAQTQYQGASGDPVPRSSSDSYDIDHPVSVEDLILVTTTSFARPMDIGAFYLPWE